MIEHNPWIGRRFDQGINSSRIVIVGHSHYGDSVDDDDKTVKCLTNVISGEWRIAFFNSIRDYFGFKSHNEFWQRVAFFNYVPAYVATSRERYGRIAPIDRPRAKLRFAKILKELSPDKVFIFTKAIVGELPLPTGTPHAELEDVRVTSFTKEDGGLIPVYLFRDPQFAPKQRMLLGVQQLV